MILTRVIPIEIIIIDRLDQKPINILRFKLVNQVRTGYLQSLESIENPKTYFRELNPKGQRGQNSHPKPFYIPLYKLPPYTI